MQGIYCIVNKINNKRYIGSSINLKSRLAVHKTNSSNFMLRNDLNKLGLDNFEFFIYEYYYGNSATELLNIEQRYLDYFPKDKLYNVKNKSTSPKDCIADKRVRQFLEDDLIAIYDNIYAAANTIKDEVTYQHKVYQISKAVNKPHKVFGYYWIN